MNKMERTNCPNCGAPIEHRYNHNCSYCGTFFDYRTPIEETKKLNPKYFTNMKLVDIRRNIYTLGMEILFEGDYLPYSEPLEYNNRENMIVMKWENPLRVKYKIEINDFEFEEIYKTGNLEYIFEKLPFEVDYDQIAKLIVNFFGRGFRNRCGRYIYE